MTPTAADPAGLLRSAWSALASGQPVLGDRLGRRLLALHPNHPGALHVLALCQWSSNHLPAALDLISRAAILDPRNAILLSDLGALRAEDHDWPAAAEAFTASLRLRPGDLTALQGRAESLLHLGRFANARQACRDWISIAPDNERPYLLLAHALAMDAHLDEALDVAEACWKRAPESVPALTLMAEVLRAQKRYELSLQYARMAVDRSPGSADALARLTLACWEVGDIGDALSYRTRALKLRVSNQYLLASLDYLALFDPAQTASRLLALYRRSAAAWTAPRRSAPAYPNSPDPGRKLRIGYLSSEFAASAASCFLTPWLRCHDPAQVTTYYYMSRPRSDAHTALYRSVADHWRDVRGLDDARLERLIRDDAIDILVDLSGRFEDNRLSVFARRPAPLQVCYPNYPSTTGCDGVDYLLTDIWTTPAGCEAEYSEQIYRLPSGYLVFQPGPREVPLSPLPAAKAAKGPSAKSTVTFGLFQRPGKLHPALWDAIATILARTPGSRLLIHFGSSELDQPGSPAQRRLLAQLQQRGIATERVLFRGTRPTPAHLAVVAQADIALDSFPYNGQTTTCDCLWMGVPVVSLRGHTHVSRITPGLLDRMELSHLVAATLEDYVQIAVGLATDLESVAELRRTLRQSMYDHSLTDGARLAREIETAYRDMWRRWCATRQT